MRSEHASAPLAFVALFVLGITVIHGSASCTLNQSGTAEVDVFAGASSSSTGAGGATASSGTTTSASSTTGMAGSENCLDGQDNDGDSQIDCADAACQAGFECTDPAPAGWTDYVRVHTTPFGMSTGITCPDGSTPLQYLEGPAGAPQCSMCKCSLMGASCGAPPIACYFGSPNCMGTADLTHQATATGCVGDPNVNGAGASASCRLTGAATVLVQGTCTSSGGTMTNPTPPWDQDVLLCGPPNAGAGCPGGQACVPKGGGDFGGSVCITRAGTDTCPTGWTTTRLQAYATGTDNRACSACSCTAACTGGRYTTHDLDDCMPPGGFDHADAPITSNNCIDIGSSFDNNTGSLTPQLAQPSAMCSGGTPTGQVDAQEPHVICCP